MRRFIITSVKFSGEAEIFYDDKGTLCKIDAMPTNMSKETIDAFKRAVPACIDTLLQGKTFSTGTTIIEADYEITFDMFWRQYNKKINKVRCILLFGKLNKTEQIKAFVGIKEYDRYLKKEIWRSKADPETYLRNKYWLNEYK